MKLRTFEKTSAIANLASAILLLLTGILFYILLPVDKIASDYSLLVKHKNWILLNSVSMLAIIMGIIGMPGLYLKQFKNSGWLMLLGLIITLSALVMKAAAVSWEFIIWPALLKANPGSTLLTESLIYKDAGILSFYGIFTLLFVLGYILFGIASFKSGVFPKWSAILLIIGGPAYAILLSVPPFGIIGLILYAFGLFGFGFTLYNNSNGERS